MARCGPHHDKLEWITTVPGTSRLDPLTPCTVMLHLVDKWKTARESHGYVSKLYAYVWIVEAFEDRYAWSIRSVIFISALMLFKFCRCQTVDIVSVKR